MSIDLLKEKMAEEKRPGLVAARRRMRGAAQATRIVSSMVVSTSSNASK